MKCENCGIEHDGEYGSGRFCSSKCARSFSTKAKRKEINKKVSEKLSGRKFKKLKILYGGVAQKQSNCLLNNRSGWQNPPPPQCKYCECNIEKGRVCKKCKPFIKNIKLFKKIGVYKDGISLDKLNNDALELLYEEYFINKKSKLVLMEEYNLMSNTIYNFFKKNGIKLRTLSEASKIALIEDRMPIKEIRNQYISGKHITWDGKEVYYRSSYELEYCKILDKKMVEYSMESLRIKYYDSQKGEYRVAIPDFYLPKSNTIIEIKSNHTFDVKNMEDKVKSYKNKGYNFKLILEKEDKTDIINEK